MTIMGTLKFGSVEIKILSNSPNATVAELVFRAGEKASRHNHPNEEYNYVVKGMFDCFSDGTVVRLGPGDSVSVKPGSDHSLHCVSETDGLIVTFWTPSRTDFIAQLKSN